MAPCVFDSEREIRILPIAPAAADIFLLFLLLLQPAKQLCLGLIERPTLRLLFGRLLGLLLHDHPGNQPASQSFVFLLGLTAGRAGSQMEIESAPLIPRKFAGG